MLHQSTEYQGTSNNIIIQQKINYNKFNTLQRKTINALDTALSFNTESCSRDKYLQTKLFDCPYGKNGHPSFPVKQTTGQSWDWYEKY